MAGAENGHFSSTKFLKFLVELKSPNLAPKCHKTHKLNPEQAISVQEQINDGFTAWIIGEVEQLSDGKWVCQSVPLFKPHEG